MSNPRCKPHNAFTNHEVELIRQHWPTKMPIEDLLAMLPRHTLNSVTGYANKKLGLSRPVVRKNAPAWDGVKALLTARPHSAAEIAKKMGFTRTRAHEILKAKRDEWHVAEFKWPENQGRAVALYAIGNLPDAVEPMGAQRARRLAVRRAKNPFFAAAGLVQAPACAPGRVYRQAMNVNDEEQAA